MKFNSKCVSLNSDIVMHVDVRQLSGKSLEKSVAFEDNSEDFPTQNIRRKYLF